MFEKLNMERNIYDTHIEYHFKNDMDYPYGIYAYIDFDLNLKSYHSNMVNLTRFQEAINQQMKEIGVEE